MKYILLIAILNYAGATGNVAEETPDPGFLDRFPFLVRLTDRHDFPWAKPIQSADMDLIRELLESGFLSDTRADWYVQLPPENDE
jgi:hypothetical protein